MILQSIAEFIGFGSFIGMILYFLFLAVIVLIGIGIYYGQKPPKKD